MQQTFFEIHPYIEQKAHEAQDLCQEAFRRIEAVAEYNAQKVLAAFIGEGISESHLMGTTGYGYGDRGRDALDRVFARVVGAEDALVRHNFVNGTHALSTALFGVLRPGDVLLSLTGKPYDTLENIIGLGEHCSGCLMDFGVQYRQLDLQADGSPDYDGIPAAVQGVKVAYIQRSRGYSLRNTLDIAQIRRICQQVRKGNPDALILVDNCYGEFTELEEPTQVGADLIMGSLIKNPGGGIAQTGGYIAGRKDLVELCAFRLTTPGAGKEVGCTLGQNRNMFMGLFFAPTVVESALKTAVFAAALFELLGYEVYPKVNDPRSDIIQAVKLGTPEALVAFCQGIQKGAPIDSFVTPEPWDMPGYNSPIIMAAGAFTMGASIELSADAPLREPYAAWMQGGLTYPSGKMGVILAADSLVRQGVLPVEK